jgi:hypothetical protein
LFAREKFCRGYAWDWLVAEARFNDCKIDANGRTITLRRGQLSHSIRFIASVWNWDKAAVSRFLTRLKTESMIETATETGQLVITICNYDKFQAEGGATETPSETATETPARQQRDSSETNKKDDAITMQEGSKNLPPPPSSPTSARADPLPVVVVADQPDNPSFRERLLVAMGHDPTGMTASGRIVGSPGDMLEAGRWQRDLGFDEATILDVVKHVCATKRDGPPTSFAYFTQAMERHAAALKASPLAPVAGTPSAPAKRGWAPPKPFKPEPPRDKGKTKQGMREIAAMVDELRQKAKGGK